MDGRASKNKGAQGEREFAAKLNEHGIEARRHGKQFYDREGTREHADVDHNLPLIHFEVKRREKLNLSSAFRQALTERPDKMPAVAHRVNRAPWLVTFMADDILPILNDVRVRTVLAQKREEGALSDTHLPLSPDTIAEETDMENEGGMIYED